MSGYAMVQILWLLEQLSSEGPGPLAEEETGTLLYAVQPFPRHSYLPLLRVLLRLAKDKRAIVY